MWGKKQILEQLFHSGGNFFGVITEVMLDNKFYRYEIKGFVTDIHIEEVTVSLVIKIRNHETEKEKN